MNSQILRIVIAGVLSTVSLIGVFALALTGRDIPSLVAVLASAPLFYLFGVTTNGAGFGAGRGQ